MFPLTLMSRSHKTGPTNHAHGTCGEGGQILILFALSVVVLIGFAAVSVDLGSYLKVRRDYQNAADGAALAGAPFLMSSSPDRTRARAAAWASLQSQLGITVAVPTGNTPANSPILAGAYKLWVSTPPIESTTRYPVEGESKGPSDKTIFVWVEAQSPSYLSRIFGLNGSLVSAWATAGIFPDRYAVITLRQPTQAGPAYPNINLAGNGASLTVINGNVGGNWNMKLNAGSNLYLPDDSQVYLHDYTSQGPQDWSPSQISTGGLSSSLKAALQLPGPIPDPNYPLPTTVAAAPAAPTALTGTLPYGYVGNPDDKRSKDGTVLVGTGGDSPAVNSVSTVGGVATCNEASAVRVGPGYYDQIKVAGPYCVILDPTYRHTCISGAPTCVDAPTVVPKNQLPGVFYINGTLEVGNGAMVVGDGVTLVLRPTNNSPDKNTIDISGGVGSPAIVGLNRGLSPLVTTPQESGAWTRRGVSPYIWAASGACLYGAPECWQYTASYQMDPTQTGIALYVMRRDQIPGLSVLSDNNTSIVKVNASAALSWTGISYAPHDNVTLAGQPGHKGVGQLVSWTFTFNGSTDVIQTYKGPIAGIPLLMEPKLGQP